MLIDAESRLLNLVIGLDELRDLLLGLGVLVGLPHLLVVLVEHLHEVVDELQDELFPLSHGNACQITAIALLLRFLGELEDVVLNSILGLVVHLFLTFGLSNFQFALELDLSLEVLVFK